MEESKKKSQTPNLDKTGELAKTHEYLSQFLSLKFHYANSELEAKIEDPEADWEKKLSNWDAIMHHLRWKPSPADSDSSYPYKGPSDQRPITVILPKNPERNFKFLKAAAYFPWQLEPNQLYPEYYYDDDMLVQLAFAAKNGYVMGRARIHAAAEAYPLLPLNHYFNTCGDKSVNENGTYYEFQLPKEEWGYRKVIKKRVHFDPKKDREKSEALFDYLLEIFRKGGERPKKVTYM